MARGPPRTLRRTCSGRGAGRAPPGLTAPARRRNLRGGRRGVDPRFKLADAAQHLPAKERTSVDALRQRRRRVFGERPKGRDDEAQRTRKGRQRGWVAGLYRARSLTRERLMLPSR